MKQISFNKLKLFYFILNLFFLSCHKSPGAICNDGHRSYSSGIGTCSWHGGVHHYINTDEISIPKTVGFVVILFFIGRIILLKKNDS
jgi:hypothetical protein